MYFLVLNQFGAEIYGEKGWQHSNFDKEILGSGPILGHWYNSTQDSGLQNHSGLFDEITVYGIWREEGEKGCFPL